MNEAVAAMSVRRALFLRGKRRRSDKDSGMDGACILRFVTVMDMTGAG